MVGGAVKAIEIFLGWFLFDESVQRCCVVGDEKCHFVRACETVIQKKMIVY